MTPYMQSVFLVYTSDISTPQLAVGEPCRHFERSLILSLEFRRGKSLHHASFTRFCKQFPKRIMVAVWHWHVCHWPEAVSLIGRM
jgi:hypothetical protein